MSSSELKKILHELCQIVRPYRIAYELTHGGRDSTSAGENPQPSCQIGFHPDSPFDGCGAGSLEAPRKMEENKK